MALAAMFVGTSGAGASTPTRTSPQSEAAAIARVRWMSNVSVALGHGSWTLTSDGVPASDLVAPYYAVPANPFDVSAAGARVVASSSVLRDQDYDYTLPLTPKYSSTTTAANQGPIGVLLDGAALYNPFEANHATVATSDNFVATVNGVTASFLDSCDGHPGPGGQYHYHGLPACLVSEATGAAVRVGPVNSTAGATTAGVARASAASKEPLILGFAFDGYGIYDNVAMNGATVPVSALDACNGIFSPVPGYPHGVYHYVLENVKGARSSISCYHGVVSSAYTQALATLLIGPKAARAFASATGTTRPATAASLAANRDEDDYLRAMLRVSGLNSYC
jgi:hypothetical protein